jgi:hypothetical protein
VKDFSSLAELKLENGRLTRAVVDHARDSGLILIIPEGGDAKPRPADLLETGDRKLRLAPGDHVLAWISTREDERSVVLGRLGPSHAPAEEPKEIPEEIVLEAGRELTLRCGEGTITLREDGKILIRGKDLVSRAERSNRIKGGSVSIN